MKTKVKILVVAGVVLALAVLLLPPLARRIDSTIHPVLERAAALEAQYRDMTNAHIIAAETTADHPMHRVWSERRAALMKAGYIETRELRLGSSLAAKGAVMEFFKAFHARFPGVERSLRDARSDAPVVSVTARASDFGHLGAIERFVTQYEPAK